MGDARAGPGATPRLPLVRRGIPTRRPDPNPASAARTGSRARRTPTSRTSADERRRESPCRLPVGAPRPLPGPRLRPPPARRAGLAGWGPDTYCGSAAVWSTASTPIRMRAGSPWPVNACWTSMAESERHLCRPERGDVSRRHAANETASRRETAPCLAVRSRRPQAGLRQPHVQQHLQRLGGRRASSARGGHRPLAQEGEYRVRSIVLVGQRHVRPHHPAGSRSVCAAATSRQASVRESRCGRPRRGSASGRRSAAGVSLTSIWLYCSSNEPDGLRRHRLGIHAPRRLSGDVRVLEAHRAVGHRAQVAQPVLGRHLPVGRHGADRRGR